MQNISIYHHYKILSNNYFTEEETEEKCLLRKYNTELYFILLKFELVLLAIAYKLQIGQVKG